MYEHVENATLAAMVVLGNLHMRIDIITISAL